MTITEVEHMHERALAVHRDALELVLAAARAMHDTKQSGDAHDLARVAATHAQGLLHDTAAVLREARARLEAARAAAVDGMRF